MNDEVKPTRGAADGAESYTTDFPAEDEHYSCSQSKQIEGRKRARSCSHDTFQELERFLKVHGLGCNNNNSRYCTHESKDEEGSDMSFLLCMEQNHDRAVHVATCFLNTEQ
jgi:hypothetical protein